MKLSHPFFFRLGLVLGVVAFLMFSCSERERDQAKADHAKAEAAHTPPKNEAEGAQRIANNDAEINRLKNENKLLAAEDTHLHNAAVMARAAWVAGLLGLAAVACGVLAFVVPEQARRFIFGAVGCAALGAVVLAYREVVPYQAEIGWGIAALAVGFVAWWAMHLRKVSEHGVRFGDAVVADVTGTLAGMKGVALTSDEMATRVEAAIESVKKSHAATQTKAKVKTTINKLRKA